MLVYDRDLLLETQAVLALFVELLEPADGYIVLHDSGIADRWDGFPAEVMQEAYDVLEKGRYEFDNEHVGCNDR